MSAEQNVDGWHVWHERRTSRRRLKQAVLRTMSLTKNDLGRERTRNMTLHRDQTDGHRPPCHRRKQRPIAQTSHLAEAWCQPGAKRTPPTTTHTHVESCLIRCI